MRDAKLSLEEFLEVKLSEKDMQNLEFGYNEIYNAFKKDPIKAAKNYIGYKDIIKEVVLSNKNEETLTKTSKFEEEFKKSTNKKFNMEGVRHPLGTLLIINDRVIVLNKYRSVLKFIFDNWELIKDIDIPLDNLINQMWDRTGVQGKIYLQSGKVISVVNGVVEMNIPRELHTIAYFDILNKRDTENIIICIKDGNPPKLFINGIEEITKDQFHKISKLYGDLVIVKNG